MTVILILQHRSAVVSGTSLVNFVYFLSKMTTVFITLVLDSNDSLIKFYTTDEFLFLIFCGSVTNIIMLFTPLLCVFCIFNKKSVLSKECFDAFAVYIF